MSPPDRGEEDERRQYFAATGEGRRVAVEELTMYARVLRTTSGLEGAAGDRA